MTEMVRKITLSRAVRTMQDLFPEEYNFYPRSWILPEEFPLFVAEVYHFSSCSLNNVAGRLLWPCHSLLPFAFIYLLDYLKKMVMLILGNISFSICLRSGRLGELPLLCCRNNSKNTTSPP